MISAFTCPAAERTIERMASVREQQSEKTKHTLVLFQYVTLIESLGPKKKMNEIHNKVSK